jgi:parallel beta-helix repeat protein
MDVCAPSRHRDDRFIPFSDASSRRSPGEEHVSLASARRRLLALLVTSLVLLVVVPAAQASVLTVCASSCSSTTIGGAVTLANPGDTITVSPGTYAESLTINKAGLTLVSSGGAAVTTITSPTTAAAVAVPTDHVTIDGFKITHSGNTSASVAAPGTGVALGVGGGGFNTVKNSVLQGNRTAIDVNNSSNNTITDNVLSGNRTGMVLRNQTNNTSVLRNAITGNWTLGVIFLDATNGASNSPPQQALGSTFNYNDISGNWYGDVVDRQASPFLPTPGTANVKNFENNWFGTNTPTVSTSNSTEGSVLSPGPLPPSYGGSDSAPGGIPNILGPASANIDYLPNQTQPTTTQVVPAGGTASTGSVATPTEPVQAEVTSPEAGGITIQKLDPEAANLPPATFTVLGKQIAITAPTPAFPAYLTLTFHVDASVLPGGLGGGAVDVFRDGVALPDCTGPGVPLPCVFSRSQPGGPGTDVAIVVHSEHASDWLLAADDILGPDIVINRPYQGARYSTYADPKPDLTAAYSCSDPSGVATCVGTVSVGSPFSRTPIGAKSFTVTATDLLGNQSTRAVNYTIFSFAGLIADDNPFGFWRLGDNDGAETLGATTGPAGEYKNGQHSDVGGVTGDGDRARLFTGADGYGYVNNLTAKPQYTLSAFVKLDSPARSASLLQHGGAGAIWYSATDQKVHFRPVDWDTAEAVSSSVLSASAWHHVAGTFDGTTARLYVDGGQVGTVTSDKAPSGQATFYVGYGDKAPWLRGWVDEVAYFGAALSATHVKEIWLADPPYVCGKPAKAATKSAKRRVAATCSTAAKAKKRTAGRTRTRR